MRFDEVVRELVLSNRARLFPEAEGAVDILDVRLGPPLPSRDGRFGRRLDILYRRAEHDRSLALWLKFRPGLDALFPMLADFDRRLACPVFPRPYFAWRSPDDDTAALATAFVGGTTLLNRLRCAAITRRTASLEPVLRSNGSKMRRFHDASPPLGSIAVEEIADGLAAAIRTTPHLAPPERERLSARLTETAVLLQGAALPRVRTHNDWALRNVVVTREGADYVIDTDDMQAAPHSRWHDVGLMMLDVEIQLKWSPLVARSTLSRLWQAFWQGYAGGRGLPDGLAPAPLAAILYLVRLQLLVQGVVHQPHLEILLDGRWRNRRIRRRLTEAALQGRCSLLDFRLGG